MTLEVLSEEDIKVFKGVIENRDSKEINQWPDVTFKAAINTIKLQRQQLAEQERKVWNEAVRLGMEKIQNSMDDLGSNEVLSREVKGLGIAKDCIEVLLKPESEASGELNNEG